MTGDNKSKNVMSGTFSFAPLDSMHREFRGAAPAMLGRFMAMPEQMATPCGAATMPVLDTLRSAADWWKDESIRFAEKKSDLAWRQSSSEEHDSLAFLERDFNERAERWEKESAIHSSPSATYLYKDYIAVIASGMTNPSVIVPLILKRIPETGADWFFALENIVGENPAENAEDLQQALTAWHQWAKQNGLVKGGDGVLGT